MAGAVPIPWLQLVLVALGGALGSVARFLGSGAVHRLFPGLAFPVGTLAVNVAGSLVIGLIGGLAEGRQFLVPDLRVFLLTGVLGGFTTFSAFAFESLGLGLDGAWTRLVLNVGAQLLLGLGAAWAGYGLGRAL
ncbi:MAG: CrcB family protein [Gammaproteobacteria bacterium]|nr:MAG: CrcB family protein [Gammaproteobacteria bacterium]